MAAYATAWEAANAEALYAEGPLWIALGDSTAQGVGTSVRERGYVPRVLERLRSARDGQFRVVNLSRSGALVTDVLHDQLPRLAGLPTPALVTCAVGANDLLRDPRSLADNFVDLVDALPVGSAVATVPRGVRERAAKAANATLVDAARARGLVVVDLWAHTGPPWRGRYSADGFHPNDLGYDAWVRAFADALEL